VDVMHNLFVITALRNPYLHLLNAWNVNIDLQTAMEILNLLERFTNTGK
jgi:hypothetical protein